MELLFLITTIVFIILISLYLACYLTHISQSFRGSKWNKYGNYFDFVRQFRKFDDWENSTIFKYSFFGKGELHDNYYIHASIFRFDDKGMILDPMSFLAVCVFLRIERKRLIKLTQPIKPQWKW